MDNKDIKVENIEVEITERVMFDEHDLENSYVGKISQLGVSLSIDDFGTGFSSLGCLKTYSIDRLKIDKSFVMSIPNKEDEALCRAILSIADALSLSLIAEGIETKEQRDFLLENGCLLAQGYYFCKPMSENKFRELLKRGL
ncbi:MAG: EAL domain-containing protein [Sulfurimonas sp.]|nr:EAL domain-containing protein [Sulfurimonas sp.]